MKTDSVSPKPQPVADSTAIKAAILYDEFASGVRAKGFAERLAKSIGRGCRLFESLWRHDLLDSPRMAAVAALDASDFDYLIVSLHGGQALSYAVRQWINVQLDGAGERGAGVILLSGFDQAAPRALDGAHRQLRDVCDANGVAFFCHTMKHSDAEEPASRHDETEEPEAPTSMARWKPAFISV
jgi:hypothetical protein